LGSILCLALPRRHSTEPWILGLATLLIIGAYILFRGSMAALRRRTGHIVLAGGEAAFVIGQSWPYAVRSMVYAFAWLAAITAAQPSTLEAPWSIAERVRIPLFVSLFGIVIAISGLALLVGRPRIELSPQGLGILQLFYQYAVPWDAISSPTPRKPDNRRAPHTIRLNIARPDLVSSRGLSRHHPRRISLPLGLIYPAVDVADLIDHYVTHPEDRDAIGTRDQLQSLRHSGLA
jgi:hypothetical protein